MMSVPLLLLYGEDPRGGGVMSRGLGAMEREVLDTMGKLPGNWMRLSMVARIILMDDISPLGAVMGTETSWLPRYPSVKRAARSLERKGLIERESRANQCYIRVMRTSPSGTLNQGVI